MKIKRNTPPRGFVHLATWLAKCAFHYSCDPVTIYARLQRGSFPLPTGTRREYLRRVFVPANSPVPFNPTLCQPGESPLKHWLMEQAGTLRISMSAAYGRYCRGKLRPPGLRHATKTRAYVTPSDSPDQSDPSAPSDSHSSPNSHSSHQS